MGARISQDIPCYSTYNLSYSHILQVYSGSLFHSGKYYIYELLKWIGISAGNFLPNLQVGHRPMLTFDLK